jgi:hypothetical protein
MALDNAALLEVLEAMQSAGVEDRVRTAAQTIYQALIDAESDLHHSSSSRHGPCQPDLHARKTEPTSPFQLMRLLERIGETGDPTRANQLLGSPTTTVPRGATP